MRLHSHYASPPGGEAISRSTTTLTMATTISASAVRPKLVTLRDELRHVVLERDDEIDASLWALLSRTNFFLLGAPGTGKSYLLDQTVARIEGVKTFDYLLNSQATTSDLFGPKDLIEYRSTGVWRHRVDGTLGDCHIARLRELFKGGEGILNSLLDALLERKMTQGDRTVDLPLSSAFCDSNEIPGPDDDRLSALWDRLPQRMVVKELSARGLRRALDVVATPTPAKVISWAEVEQAQREAASIPVSDEAKDALLDIVGLVRRESIRVSDRRAIQSPVIFQACAYLDGADEVGVEHLEPLTNMLWQEPEQVSIVQSRVLSVTSPSLKEAFEVADVVAEFADKFDEYMKMTPKDRYEPLTELQAKLKRARADVDKLVPLAVGGKAKRSVEHTIQQIEALAERIKTEAFGF